MERVSNQRGRAGFVFGEVREFAACPLPDLFYFLKISDTRLPPSRLVLIEENSRFTGRSQSQIGACSLRMSETNQDQSDQVESQREERDVTSGRCELLSVERAKSNARNECAGKIFEPTAISRIKTREQHMF